MATWRQYYDNHKRRFGAVHEIVLENILNSNFRRNLSRDLQDEDAKAMVIAERIVELSTSFAQVNERLGRLHASVSLTEGRFIDLLNSPQKLFARGESSWILKEVEIPYPNGIKNGLTLRRILREQGITVLGEIPEPEVVVPGTLSRDDKQAMDSEYYR